MVPESGLRGEIDVEFVAFEFVGESIDFCLSGIELDNELAKVLELGVNLFRSWEEAQVVGDLSVGGDDRWFFLEFLENFCKSKGAGISVRSPAGWNTNKRAGTALNRF